jgi:hypothetical protein
MPGIWKVKSWGNVGKGVYSKMPISNFFLGAPSPPYVAPFDGSRPTQCDSTQISSDGSFTRIELWRIKRRNNWPWRRPKSYTNDEQQNNSEQTIVSHIYFYHSHATLTLSYLATVRCQRRADGPFCEFRKNQSFFDALLLHSSVILELKHRMRIINMDVWDDSLLTITLLSAIGERTGPSQWSIFRILAYFHDAGSRRR